MPGILDFENLLTLKEAAAKVGYSVRTLERAIAEQELKSYLLGRRKISLSDLEIWVIQKGAKVHGNFKGAKKSAKKI